MKTSNKTAASGTLLHESIRCIYNKYMIKMYCGNDKNLLVFRADSNNPTEIKTFSLYQLR